jgi:hypothetical protein
MSALAPKADVCDAVSDVCYGPNSGHYTSFYSITSSALARSVGGTVRPSTLAVLRLRTNSNFVGCSTGGAATHTMLAPYDGVGIEVHNLFEQKFVCNLERSSRRPAIF